MKRLYDYVDGKGGRAYEWFDGQPTATIVRRGKTFLLKTIADAGPDRRRRRGAGWPNVLFSAGINAAKVPAMMERDKRFGLNVRYTKDGCPVMESQRMQDQYCRAHGMFDKQGGYGSPARGDSQKYFG